MLDYALPDISAEQFLETLHQIQPNAPFMIVTGQGSEQIAVEMMKRGAKDYLVKDSHFLDNLPHVAGRALMDADRERRLRETGEELRQSREYLRAVLSAFPIAIWAIDRESKVTYFAAPMLEQKGVFSSKVVGKSLSEVFEFLPQAVENGRRALNGETFEFNIDRGESSWDGYYMPLKAEPGQAAGALGEPVGALGVAMNVAGREKMEKQRHELEMRLQSKLRQEAIGALASGLGHEINNPLNAMINYAQLIMDLGSPESREVEFAKEIISEGDQIARIVKTLSALSRQDSGHKEFAQPDELVHSVLMIGKRSLEKDGITGAGIHRAGLAPGSLLPFDDSADFHGALIECSRCAESPLCRTPPGQDCANRDSPPSRS